jgi:hypothetical protein
VSIPLILLALEPIHLVNKNTEQFKE